MFFFYLGYPHSAIWFCYFRATQICSWNFWDRKFDEIGAVIYVRVFPSKLNLSQIHSIILCILYSRFDWSVSHHGSSFKKPLKIIIHMHQQSLESSLLWAKRRKSILKMDRWGRRRKCSSKKKSVMKSSFPWILGSI